MNIKIQLITDECRVKRISRLITLLKTKLKMLKIKCIRHLLFMPLEQTLRILNST